MRARILRLIVIVWLAASPLNVTPDSRPKNSGVAAASIEWYSPIALHPPLRPLSAGIPQTITLDIAPATLIANSAATAMVTATVVDLTGTPVSGVSLSGFITPSTRGTLSALSATDTNGQSTGSWASGSVIGSGTIEIGNGIVSGTASINLTAGALATVTVVPSNTTVTVGLTTTFTANGTDQFGNAVAITPTWSSNAGSIDSTGVFTAQPSIANGRFVTATADAISGTAMVNVLAGPLVSITVSPSPANVVAGATQTFTANGFDKHNNSVPITPTWTTNGGSINGSSGLFTAQITATTSRLVTATNDAISGTANVNIVAGPLNRIIVSPGTVTLTAAATQAFSAGGLDQYGNSVPIAPTWTTNGGSINGSSGFFAAQITATTSRLVTATNGAISGTANVNIVAGPLNRIIVSPGTVTLTAAATQAFSAGGFDQYGNSVPIAPSWTTNGGSISSSGVFTAQTSIATGRRVTATQGITTGVALINLLPGAPYTLTLQPPTAVISAGQSIAYTAIATDTFGNPIGNVASSTTFSIPPQSGGSFAANVVTPTMKNTWIVTGVNVSAVCTATLAVTAATFNHLTIEDAPAGSGAAVHAVTLNIANTLPVYAAAYDVYDNLVGAPSVTWGGTGIVAGHLAPTTAISTTFTPVVSGTGTITATSGAITTTTGIITVQSAVLRISKTASPDPLTPGNLLQYTILYTNTGDAPAQNVTITETFPLSTAFVSAFPAPTSGTNVWSIGSLAANDARAISVFLTTPSQMPVGSVLTNSVRMSAVNVASAIFTTTTPVNALPGLSASIIDGPDPVRPGDLLNYTILYRNTGTAPVTHVRVTETYPSYVSYVSAVPLPDIGNNVWLTNTLNAVGDNSRTIVVTVRVGRPLTDTTILDNQVVVSAQEAPPYTTTQQTLIVAPELQVNLSASPLTPTANSLLTYTLSYTNSGSSYASNTTITDALPANTSFAQCQPIGCGVNGSVVTWSLGQLDQLTSDAVTLTVQVANNLPNGTIITNTARIISTDQVSAAAQLTSTVASAPEVTLSKSDGITEIAARQLTTYTLSFANMGTAAAANVVITDRIPDYTTFVSCSSCIPTGGGVYSFTLGTLNAGQNGGITMSLRVSPTLPAGLRAITNTAAIATSTSGDGLTNNVAQDVNAISTRPVLDLSVTYDSRTPYPGKVITYTLRYTNTSDMDTNGVVITATRPAWLASPTPGWVQNGTTDVRSIGNLAARQSGSITYVLTLPVSYTLDMNAFIMTFFIQDGGPGGLPEAQDQITAFIGVPDLSIAQVMVPATIAPNKRFTATLIISNSGLGRACNATNCAGFLVDTFVDPAVPPPSYPYVRDGSFFEGVPPIAAGLTATVVIADIYFTPTQQPKLYFKIDNFDCSPPGGADPCLPSHSLGGLVPEYNEDNNVVGPIIVPRFAVYLPLVRKTLP